ncbi:ABC transporter substrate-binding protein [Arthrobacter sp. 92]|jgi:iron complex transport system substrate-binding protein|uniref:ABC transporter substrate-binding protein n=1 Tax=Arthrobacter sp. 92 TaxID=3418175 RepID=UPI003D07E494
MQENTSGSDKRVGRRSFLIAAAAISPLLLSGCVRQQGGPGSAESGTFPVTLPHAFGSTTVQAAPTRIATLGYASQDVCIELGVVPAGVPQYELRGFGTSLWFNKAVTAMNAVMPAQYRDAEEPPYEELKSLKPDLILAVNSGISREEYDRLTEIAPVVAYPGKPFGTDWRTTTTTVGKAIGKPQAAQDLIASVEEGISKARSSYTDLNGSSFIYLGASQAPGADFEVYDEDSNQVRILKDFGVVPSPVMAKVVAEGSRKKVKAGTGPVLWESRRAGELQADIDVVAVFSDKQAILKDGVLNGLPGAKHDSLVLVRTSDDALALVEASPLGVKWVTWTVLPELARAAYEAKTSR